MLLLEGFSRTVSEWLSNTLSSEKDENGKIMKVGDFHGTQWELYHDGEDKIYIGITMYVSRGKLKKWGLIAHLEKIYGAENIVDEEEFPDMLEDPDIVISLKDSTDEFRKEILSKSEREALQDICEEHASLYKHCMSAAFLHHFKLFSSDETFDPVKLSYRENESMYLSGTKDNMAVYFSMVFQTEDDLLFGRLFLQEFADAKKHKRSLAAAPSCSFSKDRPAGLNSAKGVEEQSEDRLWITLNLFTKHIDDKNADKTIELILSFCNYVRYHISCSHAFTHSKMRSRHTNLLQVCFLLFSDPFSFFFLHAMIVVTMCAFI